MKRTITLNLWILSTIGILLTILFLLGQTMAIISYDFTVSAGLQESTHDITEVGVAFNKGFGLGDTLIYIPLLVTGIIGLLKRKALGFYAMFGAMAITIYWPVVCLSALYYSKGAPGFNFSNHTSYAILLSLIFTYGVWGLYFLFKNRDKLAR